MAFHHMINVKNTY